MNHLEDVESEVIDKEVLVKALIEHGISTKDVKKLKSAGIKTCNFLTIFSKKEFTEITSLTGDKVDKIRQTAQNLVGTVYAENTHFVFVDDLAKGVTEDYLRKRFRSNEKGFKFGKGLLSAHIPPQRHPKRKRFGFVFFKTKKHAENALKMNGQVIKSEKITVRMIVREDARELEGEASVAKDNASRFGGATEREGRRFRGVGAARSGSAPGRDRRKFRPY